MLTVFRTAAFDYQFGALTQSDNEFMKAYFGLMQVYSTWFQKCAKLTDLFFIRSDTLGSPPKSAIFMQTILPVWALQLMSKYSQRRNLVHARHTANLANLVTQQLVDSKADALLQGKGNKDILSLLGQSYACIRDRTTPETAI